MTISDEQATTNRKKLEEKTARRRAAEAEDRPGIFHRAVKFLLEQTAANNRDASTECTFFINELDILDIYLSKERKKAHAAAMAEPETDAAPAAKPRTSRRFQRDAKKAAASAPATQ